MCFFASDSFFGSLGVNFFRKAVKYEIAKEFSVVRRGGGISISPPYWKLRMIIKSREQLATNNWKQRLLYMYTIGYSYFSLFWKCDMLQMILVPRWNPKTCLLKAILSNISNGEWFLPYLLSSKKSHRPLELRQISSKLSSKCFKRRAILRWF